MDFKPLGDALTGSPEETAGEIRARHAAVINEKDRYLAIFESLSQPVFFVGEIGQIINLNLAAAALFTESSPK